MNLLELVLNSVCIHTDITLRKDLVTVLTENSNTHIIFKLLYSLTK